MELISGVILGLFILVLLVVVHELGHAIAARRNGVVVEEFGIGFPPRAWSRKLKNGVVFSLNWLPLGGFVKLQGEHDAADKKGDYGAATFWQKTRILLAGVFVNWVVAAILLTILALTGLPKIIPNQFSVPSDTKLTTQPVEISLVAKDSPAEKAGLKTGDKLVRFAGEAIPSPEALTNATKAHKGQKVEVIYNRDNAEHVTSVTLRGDNHGGEGYLGVGSGQRSTLQATWSAPVVGIVTTGQLTGATFAGIGQLISSLWQGITAQFSHDPQVKKAGGEELETAKQSVAGPIGILGVIFPAAEQAGPTQLVLLTAIISLTLAVMNVLPIPALDGGRWFTMAVFRLLQKPLTKEREESIQAAGFLTLMALVVVVTFADVSKLIK
jgi:regulator of sigma E protease